MKAIQIQEFGGPDMLEYVDLPDPIPAEGEVVVEIAPGGTPPMSRRMLRSISVPRLLVTSERSASGIASPPS